MQTFLSKIIKIKECKIFFIILFSQIYLKYNLIKIFLKKTILSKAFEQ